MFFEVIPSEVYRSGGGALTYSSEQPLLPGQLVLIPLGKKTVTGLVYRQVPRVNFPTKPIIKLLYPIPIPLHLLKSAFWLAKYYLSPLPLTANLIIPAGITTKNAFKGLLEAQNSPKTSKSHPTAIQNSTHSLESLNASKSPNSATSNNFPDILSNIPLNSAQKTALQELKTAPSYTRLLRGITGSGKTNIYLQLTANTLKCRQSTILLVPEIALTSQLVKIFQQTFGNRVVLIHSKQTMSERRRIWINILNRTSDTSITSSILDNSQNTTVFNKTQGKFETRNEPHLSVRRTSTSKFDAVDREDNHPSPEPIVVIGPRSALLAPLHNLGLIIIDEAHENAYYQENPPRYSAPRLASFIASTNKIPCILGTATPNIVDYHLAHAKKSLIELNQKAKSAAIQQNVTIIDLKDRNNFTQNRYFSNALLTALQKNIKDKHQSLIFHNRRGSSPLTICENCGWQALCPECFLPMTLHTDTYKLSCHICGHEEKVPSSCPDCQHAGIIHKGFGTKLLEAELTKIFPKAKIARFDGDNTKTDDLATLYDSVKSGEIDILIGTQTLARGLDLPHLATVGIVQADAGLALPDFAAEERTYELLTQVIGRVGRGHIDIADVFIQSYRPDHPVIQTAITSDYHKFANYLLKQRREQQMPPFTYLARLSITYKTERTTINKIRQVHNELSKNPSLNLSPPIPAFHERTNRGFTWQIIIKSTSREQLRQALIPYAGNTGYTIVLDPPSLL